ncbi:14734_t:CDS:2, partial [Cetraspora pellucida]
MPQKREVTTTLSYQAKVSSRRSLFIPRDTRDTKDITRLSQKDLQNQLEKNLRLLANEEIISKLPDKGKKLHETNSRIKKQLEKLKSRTIPLNQLEDQLSNIAISDNKKQTNKVGKHYQNNRTTSFISISESIKLQEKQKQLEEEIRFKQLTEQFEKMTVKSDIGNFT